MNEVLFKQINQSYADQAFTAITNFVKEINDLQKKNIDLLPFENFLNQDLDILTEKMKKIQMAYDAIHYLKEINTEIIFLAFTCDALDMNPVKMTLKEYISLEKTAEVLNPKDMKISMPSALDYFKEYYSKNF